MCRLWFSLCMLAGASLANASDPLLQPFAIRNHNPFMGVYGISGFGSTNSLESGASSFDFGIDIVSNFTSANTPNEHIRIDGETYRASFRYSRGIKNYWQAGVEIPLIKHSGGFLDGAINDWHSFWGLPTLGRTRVEDNKLEYLYQRNGNDLINISSATSGLGDVVVFTGRNTSDKNTLALMQIKLPTGDSSKLHGSGGVDLSGSLQTYHEWSNNWAGAGRLGIAYLGPSDVLSDLQRHWSGFGSLYISWQPHPVIAFKAQLDMHSSLYKDSEIDQLTEVSIQTTLGGSIRFGKKTFFDFGVMEDELNPDVSSDVGFHIRIRRLR